MMSGRYLKESVLRASTVFDSIVLADPCPRPMGLRHMATVSRRFAAPGGFADLVGDFSCFLVAKMLA